MEQLTLKKKSCGNDRRKYLCQGEKRVPGPLLDRGTWWGHFGERTIPWREETLVSV